MSFSKLFNFKYLLQNIKKSKMAITLFFIIVPIFTSLMIIAVEDEVFDFISLASINMVGMYIIPFIFSVSLFGFVFKKNSVDFMGSMPISRKCIFITNTIGGISLIIFLQLITLILTLILGAITDCTIFANMAFDVFIYQTIAYIFVFTIANLAMSVSGNILTQIVVTLLITFLIPFSSWYIRESNGNDYYDVIDREHTVFSVNKLHNYTAPFFIADNGEYYFNESSICKMLVLTVLYFALGLISFSKRKMEIAGESFDNKYIHFIVKALTLAPFVIILIEMDNEEFSIISILMTIIALYYFIYDLITGKRMKFKENVVGLVFSVIALYGTYSIALGIDDSLDKKFDVDSIKTIEVKKDDSFNFTINDKDKIRNIIALAGKNSGTDYYSGMGRVRVTIEITKFGGSKYYKKVYMPVSELSKNIEEPFKNILIGENAVIDARFLELSDAEETKLKNTLNDTLNKMTYEELYGVTRSNATIYLYEYRNHDMVTLNYPINISDEVANIVMNAYNKYAYEHVISGYDVYYYNIDFHGNVSDDMASKWNLVLNYCNKDEISNFILENYEENDKDYDKCALIYSSEFRFYTDKVDKLIEVLNKVYEENKEKIDEEYKNYYEPKKYEMEVMENSEAAEITTTSATVEIID